MNEMKFGKKIVTRLTKFQAKDLRPLFDKVRENPGGAVFAQIWPDGIRAVALTPEQVTIWQDTTGIKDRSPKKSAFA